MDVCAMSQACRYIDHFKEIMENGRIVSPRGSVIRECEDLQLVVDPRYPFMTFASRKYDVNYFKKEMLWKLTANPYNDSIKEYAKIWRDVQNPDGTFNSNYGQYWFAGEVNIWSVIAELIRDPDSRRAVIPMLSAKHMAPWVKDTVCTESVGFRLRPVADTVELNMSVHMRSSDAIFGLGTDIPTFAFLYRLVAGLLQPHYDRLLMGRITITAMSSHIYERHFRMAEQIIEGGDTQYEPIAMPLTKAMEAMYIVAKRGVMNDIQPSYQLANWLVSDKVY